MKYLETLVEELEKENDPKRQIAVLQNINKALLLGYSVRIGDCTVKPLLSEAYYYHRGKFEDTSTHGYKSEKCRSKQSNRFGKLYVHKIGYGGVDICLSRSDGYCLTFLIKNSLVTENGGNEKFCTQTALVKLLKGQGKDAEFIEENGVLYPNVYKSSPVVNTVRKGVKGEFQQAELASLLLGCVKGYPLTLAQGCGKERIIKGYLLSEYKGQSAEAVEKICRDILGYSLRGFIRNNFTL